MLNHFYICFKTLECNFTPMFYRSEGKEGKPYRHKHTDASPKVATFIFNFYFFNRKFFLRHFPHISHHSYSFIFNFLQFTITLLSIINFHACEQFFWTICTSYNEESLYISLFFCQIIITFNQLNDQLGSFEVI